MRGGGAGAKSQYPSHPFARPMCPEKNSSLRIRRNPSAPIYSQPPSTCGQPATSRLNLSFPFCKWGEPLRPLVFGFTAGTRQQAAGTGPGLWE